MSFFYGATIVFGTCHSVLVSVRFIAHPLSLSWRLDAEESDWLHIYFSMLSVCCANDRLSMKLYPISPYLLTKVLSITHLSSNIYIAWNQMPIFTKHKEAKYASEASNCFILSPDSCKTLNLNECTFAILGSHALNLFLHFFFQSPFSLFLCWTWISSWPKNVVRFLRYLINAIYCTSYCQLLL